jgi:predicted metal-dependent HD superfamily phosphohydrolase
VAALYNPSLPYHNFAHALDAIGAGEIILQRCREDGVPVREQVVYYALLFHDAGYHEEPENYGFSTKEDYSASLAARLLPQFGVDAGTVEMVVAAIRATHREATFSTNEQKVVRAADLAGLAADYEIFRRNSERLKDEWEHLRGEKISWQKWLAETRAIIGFFLSQDIRLTRYYLDTEGNSIFHRQTEENLRRLHEEKIGRDTGSSLP